MDINVAIVCLVMSIISNITLLKCRNKKHKDTPGNKSNKQATN